MIVFRVPFLSFVSSFCIIHTGMNPFIVLSCIIALSYYRSIFDGRFYIRFCRPTLTTVYASLEGAKCCSCNHVIGGVFNYIGCYGYAFVSGPFGNFGEMHEFYGPIRLFPGDDETARSFINIRGWNFPYVLEQYVVNQIHPAMGMGIENNNNNRMLAPFPDSYLNFLYRQSLFVGVNDNDNQGNDLLDSIIELISSDNNNDAPPVEPVAEQPTTECDSVAVITSSADPPIIESDAVARNVE